MNKEQILAEYDIQTLSGANLWRADLAEADLSGVNLCYADLSWANLSGANLNGANPWEADLSHANLTEANLSGACLYGADLTGADLSGADLTGADLWGADLTGANLSGVRGLASFDEEMRMLCLLRKAIRDESFVLDTKHWHIPSLDESSSESILRTCGTTHSGAGFCQVELARQGHPAALLSTPVAGSYAIPSMAHLFFSEEDEFIKHLDKLIAGEIPLLKR